MKKKLKIEILRLLAPILGCKFDDLRQRHRERKIKRALTISVALSLFFLLFGSYSAYQAALIKEQSEVIKQKSEEVEQKSKEVERHAQLLEVQVQKTLRGQSLYLSDIASTYLARGDRLGAVLAAREALPKNLANPERPYVEEAEYALCDALGVYKTNYTFEMRADLILRHSERVQNTAISPDGKKAVTCTDTHVIQVWDAGNGMLLNTYTPYRFTYDLHFIDDRTLLIHDQDGIYCLDVDTLEKKWSYACRGVFIAVSEDRSKAALIDSDLTVLDTATGQPIMETSLKNLFSREQYIFGKNIVFSENGSCVFFTIDDRIVAKVDIDRKELVQVYLATYDFVTGLAVSPDDRVAITSFDSEMENAYGLIVYDASGNTLYSATSADEIDDPSFIATDSDLVVYISYENLVILDIGHGNRHICAHGDIVTDYYAIDDLIITATYNGSIRFWEADGTEYSLFRIDLGMYISTVDFVPGIITLKSEKDVVLLKPFENSNALLLEGHNEFIGNIAYLEGSKRAVSCSEYGEVILWDLERAEAVKSIHINERIRDVFSVDRGSKIMIFTDSYRLLLYDSATLDLIRSETFEGLYKLTMSPDHSLCILYGREGLIIDTCTLETVAAIPRIIFSDAAFFNDNSKIILGYNELYLLDIPGMTVLKEAEVPGIDMIRLSHDNSMLACISNKNSVKLFDTANLEEKLTIECPGPTPESVFFDPTGETLFVSFSDYTIGRYKTSDGTPVGILDKKVETVKDILFSQDRNIYITMGLNESYIWKLDTHKPIGHVRGLRNADLKSGCLYVDFFEKLFVLTLQDTKMLLDEAERQLQGRTLTPEEKKRLFIVE